MLVSKTKYQRGRFGPNVRLNSGGLPTTCRDFYSLSLNYSIKGFAPNKPKTLVIGITGKWQVPTESISSLRQVFHFAKRMLFRSEIMIPSSILLLRLV